MILSAQEYAAAPTAELLRAAALCQVPLDHRFLGELIGRGDAVFADFIVFLKRDREQDRINLDEDMLRMARQLHTPAALPFLAEVARRQELVLSDELTAAFVEIGAPAIDTLLELHSEGADGFDVTFALALLRVHEPRVLARLLAGLEADPEDTALALGILGDQMAIPALERALAAAQSDSVRNSLERAITELRGAEAPELPAAYDIYEDYPEQDTPLFPALPTGELLEFLASPVAEYRAEAAGTLGAERLNDRTRPLLLALAQDDPDTHVRAETWEALEGAGEDHAVHQAMHERLDAPGVPDEERAAIVVSLAHEASEHADLRKLILDLYRNGETRAQAIKAMWHSLDRRFESYIPQHLEDEDVKIRTQALLAAGWFSMATQLSRIEAALHDDEVRSAALFAYALAAPGETSPARMRRLFRRIDELAGGLDEHDADVVEQAINERLTACDYEPIRLTGSGADEDDEPAPPPPPPAARPGRNDPCPCASGKKFKKCCGK